MMMAGCREGLGHAPSTVKDCRRGNKRSWNADLGQLSAGYLLGEEVGVCLPQKRVTKHRRKSLRRADQFLYGAGDPAPAEILASVKQGLYVTDLIGFEYQYGDRRLLPWRERVLD